MEKFKKKLATVSLGRIKPPGITEITLSLILKAFSQ